MASKKTITKKAVAPKAPVKKAPPKARADAASKAKSAASQKARHPKARVTERHSSKADLAKSLAGALVRGDEDQGELATRLARASNHQLLRLQQATETLKSKYGSRDQLIAKLGTAQKKGTDKDYLAKLATLPLPQLLALASSAI